MYAMRKILIGLCCLTLVLNGCASQAQEIVREGIKRLGPGGQGYQNPVWSPDGTKIAVTARTVVHSWTSEIFVLDIATGEKKSVMYTDNGSVTAISWVPDGSQILLSSENGGDWPEGIWTIEANGNTSPEFLTYGYDAAWSPDGKSLALISLSRENSHWNVELSVFDIKTQAKDIIYRGNEFSSVVIGNLNWSPNGKEIIFHYGQPGVGNIDLYVVKVENGKVTKIADEGENHSPSWSPDGNFIVYLNDLGKGYDPTLILADKNNTCQQDLLTLDDWSGLSWSPKGEYIAFGSHGEIYILALDKFPAYKSVCP
jgi:TolB protein